MDLAYLFVVIVIIRVANIVICITIAAIIAISIISFTIVLV